MQMGGSLLMKKENIYREAREKYNENSHNPLNREDAAEKLHVSGATLGRYETGENAPSPEVVYAMSKVYENPSLRRKHCSDCCPIGKADHPYSAPKTLFESGYGLINANRVLDTFKDELFDVLADGIVDKKEIVRLQAIIPQIKSIQKLLSDIEIEIEKHSLKYDLKE